MPFVKSILLPALVALAVTFGVAHYFSAAPAAPVHESAYDRVMRTGTLRCGYSLWPGLLQLDPNTHQMSGIMYDYLNALGQATELKIEWSEEVSYGDMPEALRDGRIDVFCGGAWTNALRGKAVDGGQPIAYQTINAYTQGANMALDGDSGKIDNPAVKISVIDGESGATIASTDFPKAQTLSLPKNSDIAQAVLNVADGKADVVFTDAGAAHAFMDKNPGKLRQVKSDFPVRVFGVPLWVGKGEDKLRNSLDLATDQLLYTGAIDRILKKYETVPGSFIRVRMPYEMPAAP